MRNYSSLITKPWHKYSFRITGTLVVVHVLAEDIKAARQFMREVYPDVDFTEVKNV